MERAVPKSTRRLIPLLCLLLAWGAAGCRSSPLDAGAPPARRVFLPYITSTPASTSGPRLTWSARYGGPGSEEMEGLLATQDGGLVVVGSTDSFQDEEGDGWIVALQGDGQVRWQRTYGGDEDDGLLDIRQTPDGGFVAVGWTRSFGAEQADVWILRLDEEGQVLWSKVYGGPGMEQAWSVALVGDGGFLVAGGTTSFGAGGADFWVLRLDAQGEPVWQRTYGGPRDDGGGGTYEEFVVRALVDREGHYVLASETASFGAGETDIWVIQLRPDGSIRWQKAYGGPEEETTWSLVELADGGYLVPGVTVSFAPDASGDLWALRLEPDGAIRWQKAYGLPALWDEALSAGATRDGGVVIGGYLDEGTDWDGTLLRLDGDGQLWARRRYEHGWDWPNGVVELADGSLAVAGVAWDRAGGRDLDLWVMRLAPDGDLGTSCGLAQELQLQVADTAARPRDTQATVGGTAVRPREAQVTVRDTQVAPRYLCAPTRR